jgi:hypothetical protein
MQMRSRRRRVGLAETDVEDFKVADFLRHGVGRTSPCVLQFSFLPLLAQQEKILLFWTKANPDNHRRVTPHANVTGFVRAGPRGSRLVRAMPSPLL